MKNDTKKWVEVWQQASSSLEEIRRKELQSSNYYDKNLKFLNEMLNYAFEHRTIRISSGLVEQQKIFRKFHNKGVNSFM